MLIANTGDICGVPATGIWFTEFSDPYNIFLDESASITVASSRGGPAPVDPRGYPA
jgi:putative intracellular protease/amidase